MKLICSVPATVVLLASLCCLVAAEMTEKSCRKLQEDSNANWNDASQVFECYELLGYSHHLYALKDALLNSTGRSNCNDPDKLWKIHHQINLENGMYRDEKQPSSIKRAFIAYGLQLSASCRWSLINLIKRKKLEAFLTDDDYAVLDGWTSDKGPLAKLFALPEENKSLALPGPMVKLLKARQQSDIQAMTVEVPPNTSFALAHAVCNRRFRPIYKQVTDPLIEMAMNGFNYEPKISQAVDGETAMKVQQWYRAVFVCKLMETINVKENTTIPAGQMAVKEAGSVWSKLELESPNYYPEVKWVEFNYELTDGRKSAGDDGLVDVNDPELMKAIKKYHEPSVVMRATLKMAASGLAQKFSKVFRDDKADKDDKSIANFLADYSYKLDESNSLLPEIKRTAKSKGIQLLRFTTVNGLIAICPIMWFNWLPRGFMFKDWPSTLNWKLFSYD